MKYEYLSKRISGGAAICDQCSELQTIGEDGAVCVHCGGTLCEFVCEHCDQPIRDDVFYELIEEVPMNERDEDMVVGPDEILVRSRYFCCDEHAYLAAESELSCFAAGRYEKFMSREHISLLDELTGFPIDLINKIHVQIMRRDSNELRTGLLYTLEQALGDDFWNSLSEGERLSADECWEYLMVFFGWSVEAYMGCEVVMHYRFNENWWKCSARPS